MTTFGGNTIPPIFGGGLASFSTLPIVLRDQTLTYVGTLSARNTIKFETFFTGEPTMSAGLITVDTVTSVEAFITTMPLQWLVDPAFPTDYSVRLRQDMGPEPFNFLAAPEGTWVRMITSRRWTISRPGVISTVMNSSIFEFSLFVDNATILARALITIVYDRTS